MIFNLKSFIINGWGVPWLIKITKDNYLGIMLVACATHGFGLYRFFTATTLLVALVGALAITSSSNVFLSTISGMLGRVPSKKNNNGSVYGDQIAGDRSVRAVAPVIGGYVIEAGYMSYGIPIPSFIAGIIISYQYYNHSKMMEIDSNKKFM